MHVLRRWRSDVQPLGRRVFCASKANAHVSIIRRSIANKSGRNYLSDYWTPTGGVTIAQGEQDDSQALLARAGFIRQSNSGIFHLLPLGLRVQNKIEALLDKYMRSLGAAKVSLSSVTSEALWTKSGRFNKYGKGNPELFRLADARSVRGDNPKGTTGLLLAPTHEEEITELVAASIKSHKELPLRLYQTSRKYRNELRPRQGLLRAKEFLMKDLYTFDIDHERAMRTYDAVRAVYAAFFDELKIPYLTAVADSGNMGGSLSHEFHYVSNVGEDHVVSCDQCSYVANEEMAVAKPPPQVNAKFGSVPTKWIGVAAGGRDLVVALLPPQEGHARSLNMHALKRAVSRLEPDIVDATRRWMAYKPQNSVERRIVVVVDASVDETSVPVDARTLLQSIGIKGQPAHVEAASPELIHVVHDPLNQEYINLLSVKEGDSCTKCSEGRLKVQKAVELGHTFHLGTRYSEPLGCTIGLPSDHPLYNEVVGQRVPLEMGCHGIGVSRLIAATASVLADDRGLNWPRAIAPFDVVIIAAEGFGQEGRRLYNVLTNRGIDAVVDDRHHSPIWKLNDADLAGYPVILLVTKRSWADERSVEVQCRRLGGYKRNHRSEEEDVGMLVQNMLENF